MAAEAAREAARDVRWMGRKMEYFWLRGIVLALSCAMLKEAVGKRGGRRSEAWKTSMQPPARLQVASRV